MANGFLDCYARRSCSMQSLDLLTAPVTLALILSASWSARQWRSPKLNPRRSQNKNPKPRRVRKRRRTSKQKQKSQVQKRLEVTQHSRPVFSRSGYMSTYTLGNATTIYIYRLLGVHERCFALPQTFYTNSGLPTHSHVESFIPTLRISTSMSLAMYQRITVTQQGVLE